MPNLPSDVLDAALNAHQRQEDERLAASLEQQAAPVRQALFNAQVPDLGQLLSGLNPMGASYTGGAPQRDSGAISAGVPGSAGSLPANVSGLSPSGTPGASFSFQMPSLNDLLGELAPKPQQPVQPVATPSGTPAAMPNAPELVDATITAGPRPDQQLRPGESVGSVTLQQAPKPKADGDYRAYARQVAQQYGLDPDIFERQINQESGFQPWGADGKPLGSSAGAQGIAQFMPGTAASYGVDVNDPYSSLDGAARHMRDLLKANKGDYRFALAAYNAGQGNVDKWGEGVFDDDFAAGQTRDYVNIILGPGSARPARVSLNAGAGVSPAAPAAASAPPSGASSPPDGGLWSPDMPSEAERGQGAFQAATGRSGGSGVMYRGPLGAAPQEVSNEYPEPAYSDPTITDSTYTGTPQPYGPPLSEAGPEMPTSYNDPTDGGTISTPVPAPLPPSYTLADGRTEPPTPTGSWEPVRTIPNPQYAGIPSPDQTAQGTPIQYQPQSYGPALSEAGPEPVNPYDAEQPWRPTLQLGSPPAGPSTPPAAPNAQLDAPVSYGPLLSEAGPEGPPAEPTTWYGRAGRAVLDNVIAPALQAYDTANEWLINNPVTGTFNPQAMGRELAGADQISREVREDQQRLESLIRRFRAGDTSVEAEIQALTANLNARTGGGRAGLLAAGERNPDKGAETAGQVAQAALTLGIAPSAASGAARNAVGAAMDPIGQGIGLAADAIGPAVRGARSVAGRALNAGADAPLPSSLGSGMVPESRRFYHGTASNFDTPDPSKFAKDGLYGPGYYLTDNPEVASSYAQSRNVAPGGITPLPELRGRRLTAELEQAQRQLADPRTLPEDRAWLEIRIPQIEAELARVTSQGPNVRPVDVADELNLFDIDRQYTPDDTRFVADWLARNVGQREADDFLTSVPGNTSGNGVYRAIQAAVGDDAARVNELLAQAGFDGVAHKGGGIMPIRDADGNAIAHDVTVVFPGGLTKLRNGFTGEVGGSGFVPRMSDARNAAQGGVVGAMSEATSDEELTPQERLARIAAGGALGVAAGRGMRGRGAAGARAGSGMVPDGSRRRWVPDARYQGGGFWNTPKPRVPEDIRAAQREAIIRNADYLDAKRERTIIEARLKVHPDDVELQRNLETALVKEEETQSVALAAKEYEQMLRAGETQLGSGFVPSGDAVPDGPRTPRLTVEVIQSRMDKVRALIAEAEAAGDRALETDARNVLGDLQNDLIDAMAARQRLEPAIASDVGRRIETLPTTESGAERTLTRDAQTGFSGQPARPDELSGPMSVPTNMAGRQNAILPFDPASAAAGAGAGTELDEEGNPAGVDPLRAAAGMAIAGIAGTPQGRRLALRAARQAKKSAPPNMLEVMQNFRFSWGMLGNFSTGAVNAMGAPVEIALGLPSEAFRMGVLRQRPAAVVYQATELLSGLRQGVREMLGTVIGQVPPAVRNAPDFRPPMSERMTGPAGKAVGHAIELPGRLASQAPDALWRPPLERWGRAVEASNMMSEAGISRWRPDEQVKEMHRLIHNPTPEEAKRLDAAAKTWADEMGYKGDAGYFEQAVGSLVRPGNKTTTANDPLAAQVHEALGSFVMPFFGAVWKLHKLAASRVPATNFLTNRSLPIDQKISRSLVGASLGLYIADRAAQGLVTGPGPSDPDEAALVNKDMPPNHTYLPSVGWVPNDFFGSAGPYLNAIGGYYDARRYATDKERADVDKMGERTAKDVMRAFERFPVVQSLQNLIAMAETPTKGVTDFLASAGSSFVPAPAKTYMASQDPLNRTTDREAGFVDQLTQKTQARTGIMRQQLPPAQDRLGRDIENPRQGLAAFGINVKQPQNDPVIKLFRENGVQPGMPKKELTPKVPGVRSIPAIPLNGKEQRDWNRARGQKLIELVQPRLNDPKFQSLTPDAKKANLQRFLELAGEYADGVLQQQIGGPEITRRTRKAS